MVISLQDRDLTLCVCRRGCIPRLIMGLTQPRDKVDLANLCLGSRDFILDLLIS